MGNPLPSIQIEAAVADFVRRWHASAAAERANFQSFCNELCDLLAVPSPDSARQNERNNAYIYDKTVWFDDGDGKRTANFIDLYKRGCFVMEAKQGSEADDGGPNLFDLTTASRRKQRRGTAVRGTAQWDATGVEAEEQLPSVCQIAYCVDGSGYINWHCCARLALKGPLPAGEGSTTMGIERIVCAAFSLFFINIVSAAQATLVALDISGTVQNPVDYSNMGYVPSGIRTGSAFVGTVTFNNAATPSSTDATDAYYSGTDLDLSVNITIAGIYQYNLTTPSGSDEIDLEGSSFGSHKRGPSVSTSFSPNPPFSHLDLGLETDTDVLSQLQVSDLSLGSTPSAGVSDAQTPGAGYYYVGATLNSVSPVPEPATTTLMAIGSIGLLTRRSKRSWRRDCAGQVAGSTQTKPRSRPAKRDGSCLAGSPALRSEAASN